ncbi:DUF3631 domain-containing protein [Virgisporangium aurantiacum]|uniref:DUF3631 domain-containing protein n=1 Tax=Virgisporangium aurantiacum TaxID=175570 RepID=A0A8J4DX62_9ACTN|nr:DUF3631 domain-containing protein [Virgisporangium aurantiacum]GIJ53216.1 hypothetical protein Vau01_007320 [Virgisporangium aurantiacum]
MTDPTTDIDGAAILDALHAAITRYVILPGREAVDAVVLWIAATHAQPAWAHAPRLVIRAPEKRCGKSRLLDVVEATSFRPIMTVNASTAAVYRSIGAADSPPTLLIDEADTIFGAKAGDANEDLRGLLNAGHQRGRPTIRWDTNTRSVERIETFAMAALAGIGQMPDTIEDRAVVIRMRRRTTGERVAPYRVRRDGPALKELAITLTGWLRDYLPELERAAPPMPVDDRAADTWEPLVAVADLAGRDWPGRARTAVTVLTAEAADDGQLSTGVRLLVDVRAAFVMLGSPAAVATTELLKVLNDDPEAAWSGFGPVGLTGKRLADLLREFGISSGNVRFPVGQAKGYLRDDFADAWNRYCPPPDDTPKQATGDASPSPARPIRPTLVSAGQTRDGLKRWDALSVPPDQSVPGLSRENDPGTDGTHTPRKPGQQSAK